MRNNVQNAWKQIDVQLKRRHDLIPNLVTTVKGAMEFEQDNTFSMAGMCHAPAAQVLDNRKPFLSE